MNAANADTGDASDVFVFPTSFPQRRLWFLDQLMPGGWAYNLTSAYRITGQLDISALEKSFSEIIRRHEILRTTFKASDGEPVQMISEARPVHLPVIDLSTLSPAERESRVSAVINGEMKHVFDLAHGPLLRLSLLKLGGGEHVLVKNIHHIISDAWSENIFMTEWNSLYESFVINKAVTLSGLPIQYADFSEWQRQTLQGDELEKQFAYWKNKLDDLPTLSLPTDRSRPAIADYTGSEVKFTLSPGVVRGLRALGRQENVTLFITLLTAFKVFLHRYTGQTEIVVGTPITNRNRAELEDLIGFFLNTLVLRTGLAGNPGFTGALRSVRDTSLEAFSHQDLPFEILVEKLRPERNLSQHPLCQVMFVMLRGGETSWSTDGINITPVETGLTTAKFDLVLSLYENGDEISASFIYSTALFDRTTVERMVRHFQTLLEGIVENATRPIDELPLLCDAEKKQLLIDWNDTSAPCSMTPVHELVAAQCARSPAAIAIEFEGRSVTYGALYSRSQEIASHLQSLGAGPGTLVGICVERSPEMIAAMLGILLVGAAYVPLDPDFPQARLEVMIEDASPSIIITQGSVKDLLPKSESHIVNLDDDLAGTNPFQPKPVTPENLAYVLFTSGSTGRPKGVEIPHGALTNLLESMRERPGLSSSDVLVAITTLSFDIAGLEIFLPLICGAKMLMVSREMAVDALALNELLKKSGVTVMQATPATWRALLVAEWKGSPKLKILCGGEAMPLDLAEQLLTRCDSLWNVYGPTETTIWSTVEKVESTEKPITVGRPIANTQIYILGDDQQPQPVGVYGELYIGGLGVAHGYLGRPELTASKFVPNPFGKPGSRLYRTGDLARYRADGSIEFLGRIDHQVKVRGYRIELAEIESSLGRHPEIHQAVVVVREDRAGDKRLVAYVVRNGTVQDSDLRTFLKSKLPEYMMPSVFVFLDALPLTPNGKVDRKALPELDRSRSDEHIFVAPRTPLEQKMAEIWGRVLGLDRIGIWDDFFELGGHSLMAVSLFAEMEKKLGKKLPLAVLFEAPTIEQLAGLLEQKGWSAPWSPLIPIQPAGKNAPFFCIHGADGAVLFYNKLAAMLAPDQPVYGLQAQGLDGGQILHTTADTMAALYIKEIRTVQPKGPYYLGGYSFGGLLALEMAQQLQAQGEQIALVVLFDANNPTVPPRRYALRERMLMRFKAISGWSLGRKLAYIWDRGVRKIEVMVLVKKEKLRRLAYRFSSVRNEVIPVDYRIVHVRETNDEAMRNYKPRTYNGRLTLIRAENPNDGFEFDSELGWGGLAADGIEIFDVPGEHETMFQEPHVQTLARTMKTCIANARLRTEV